MQRLTAGAEAREESSNARTRVEVQAESLELNVTNECLSTVLEAAAHFRQFHEVTVEKEDNYSIGVRNCTGVRGHFRVESDAGVQGVAEEHRAMLELEALGEATMCGLARVTCRTGDDNEAGEETVGWVELHATAPDVRVFKSIPFQRDATKCFLCGSQPWLDGDCLCFQNESDTQKGCTVVLSVENEEERQAWQALLDKGAVRRLPSRFTPRAAASDELPATGELVVTTLPAHPSVTLQYYGHAYRHIRERVLMVQLDGFAAFTLPVDSLTATSVVLHGDDDSHAVVVQACMEKGRKVLVLSAPLQLINNMNAPLQCGFIPSNPSMTKEEAVPSHECVWASLEVVQSGGVLVQGVTTKVIPMQLIREGRGSGLLNIGTEQQPFYVMVHAGVEEVPVLRQPSQKIPLYRLYLSPVLEVVNLVPEAVEYRVINAHEHVFACFTLKAGEKATLTSLKFRKEEGLRVSVRVMRGDFEFSTYEESIFVGVQWQCHA